MYIYNACVGSIPDTGNYIYGTFICNNTIYLQ